MTIIAGRPLNETDVGGSQKAAVVNRTLAETYFPNGQAIGKRFGQSGPDTEIVGIVDDARVLGLTTTPAPAVFYPLAQRGIVARSIEVRTTAAPEPVMAALRSALARAVPELPVESIVPMSDRVQRAMSPFRLILLMTSGFGTLALCLAGFGLFGLLANAVARRTPEFGLRMALGASRSTVVWSVVSEALWLVAVGLVLGLPVVFLGGRLISTLLFGVGPFDSLTVISATLVLIGVGGLCSAIPALRASRVDPNVALRQE
jgi:ABC-type antimicrobial peptide transport system permease subunit